MQSRKTRRARAAIVKVAKWGVNNTRQIHYKQQRPMPINVEKYHLPLTIDCSTFTTLAARWSGNPDPNGLGYNGQGFTGTMLDHLPHIRKNQTRRGDLAVFGSGSGDHVVILIQGGRYHNDPLVVSHGEEGDPTIYPLSVELRYFHYVVTYLRLRPDR